MHRADAYSWQVLQKIFETTSNVLMIGTAHSSADLSLRVNKSFWNALINKHQSNGRMVKIEIDRLSEEETICMIMKTLALKRDDVEGSDILQEVYVQSGGTPHFANKILHGIKQRRLACHPDESTADEAVAEIVLHRVDSFDVAVRSTLNVAAVVGYTFTLDELVSVFQEKNDRKEAEIRIQTAESLQFLVTEGIVYAGDKSSRPLPNDAVAADEPRTRFTFYQEVWRSTVLKLMLDSRKRDIHRKIATSLESPAAGRPMTVESMRNIFTHWKAAGDASKMAAVALQFGKYAHDDETIVLDAIRMNEETLCMWDYSTTIDKTTGGFPPEVLLFASANELAQILSIVTLNGQLLARCERTTESIAALENAIRIKDATPSYSFLVDKSVIFQAFSGLYDAVTNGYILQNADHQYQHDLVAQFVEATCSCASPIHRIHALFLQLKLSAQLGDTATVLSALGSIKRTYKPECHSAKLRQVYGEDSGALGIALGAYYEMVQGDAAQAMKTCGYVLKELYPKIEADHAQTFAMMYPCAFVLKEGGYSAQAWSLFERAVVQHFNAESKYLSLVSPVYKPLYLMLALDDSAEQNVDILSECFKWASNPTAQRFSEPLNLLLGRLGCSGDYISANLCYLLASKLNSCVDTQFTETQAKWLLAQGKWFVSQGLTLLQDHGLKFAEAHLLKVKGKLDELTLSLSMNHSLSNNLFHFVEESNGLVVRIEI
jgi:hypothetical protein